jgi:serine/threonine protein kinase/Ran GTPase-activating protein (RanGAP) involved in mRNA processing and transport
MLSWLDGQIELSKVQVALELAGLSIRGENAKTLSAALETNTTWKSLTLAHCGYFFGEDAMALAAALGKNKSLTSINLSQTSWCEKSEEILAAALETSKSLLHIVLRGNGCHVKVPKALARSLEINNWLASMNLSYNSLGDEGCKALADVLGKNTSLTSIDLCSSGIADDGARALACALEKNASLLTVNLADNEIGRDGSKALAVALEINNCLTSIDLSYNSRLGDEGVEAVADALEKNCKLTSVNFCKVSARDMGAMALARALGKNSSLTSINWSGNTVGQEGAKKLAEVLKRNTSLTYMNLSSNSLDVVPLAHALQKNTGLTTIDLSFNQIGGKGAKALAGALFKNESLLSIKLAGNRICGAGLKALARALKKNASLTSIDLCSNHMGDKDGKSLADAFGTNKSLTSVDLHGNSIGDEGCKALASGLGDNRSLKTIDLHRNKIGDEGSEALACALKKNTMLLSIDLSWNVIGAQGGKALAGALEGKSTALTCINLTRNSLGAGGAKALACALLKNETLTSIDLNHCDVRIEGLKAICYALQTNKTLTSIDLRFIGNVSDSIFSDESVKERDILRNIDAALKRNKGRTGVKAVNLSDSMTAGSKEVHGVNDEARGRTIAALHGVNMQQVYDGFAALDQVEASVVADQVAFQKRHIEREKMLQLIRSQVQLVASFLQASKSELEVLAEFAAKKEDAVDQRACLLQQQRAEMVRFVQVVETRRARLERSLAAAKEIDGVQTRVVESKKRFERSKRDAKAAEMNLESAKEDLEDKSGSQAEVDCACTIVTAANENVRQTRVAYEAAMSLLVDLRQAGYPELRCAAALKADRFPNVPSVSFGDLTVVEKIGGGAFADVLKVELPVTGVCAFKQLRSNVADEELMKEAAALWEMRFCEHVVKLLMVCREPGKQGLLLELADGGSLGDRLHKRKEVLKETEVLQILRNVAEGLESLHDQKHVHLDVKADNVLLFGSRAKLADFGTSKQACCDTYRDTKIALTFQWSAPELLCTMPRITTACDIWSFGMLMFEMLTGSVPFEGVETHQLVQTISSGVLPKVPVGVNPELVALMHDCWNQDQAKRPSATALKSAIGDLMAVSCCSCGQSMALTKGLFCNRANLFLCSLCVPESVSANLRSRTIRSDGGLEIGAGESKTLFELQSFRHLLGKDLLTAWLKAQEDATEMEVQRRLEVELEREKRKWDAMSADARVADCILFDVLPCRCPKCKSRLVYEGGCFALTCGSCSASFCAFCEAVFPNGAASHDHVPTCKQNVLQVPWYPDQKDATATFFRVQRVRQLREIKKRLENVDEDTRQKVIKRVENELALNGIKPSDL